MHLKMFMELKSLSFTVIWSKSSKSMCQVSPTELYQVTPYSLSLAMWMIPERHLALIIQALEIEEKFRLFSAYTYISTEWYVGCFIDIEEFTKTEFLSVSTCTHQTGCFWNYKFMPQLTSKMAAQRYHLGYSDWHYRLCKRQALM